MTPEETTIVAKRTLGRTDPAENMDRWSSTLRGNAMREATRPLGPGTRHANLAPVGLAGLGREANESKELRKL